MSGDGWATLLQQTQQRLQCLDALAAPLLICNEDHRFIVIEQMRQIGVEPTAILLEPMGHGQRRRPADAGGGKPEHLHPDGLQTPPFKSRPDPRGTD